MMHQIKQGLLVYLRNPVFRILVGIFIGAAVFMRLFLVFGSRFVSEVFFICAGDDLVTAIMLLSLWLPFVIGVITKRQFANQRASLLPGYRLPHLAAAGIVYTFFLAVGYFAASGFHPFVSCSSDVLLGVYLGFWLLTIVIMILSYLSIQTLLFAAYLITILILSNSSPEIMQWLGLPAVNLAAFVFGWMLFGLLAARLMRVREECFEYPYLISWPQKDLIENQLRARQIPSWLVTKVRKLIGVREKDRTLIPYSCRKGLAARAVHWELHEMAELKNTGLLFVLILPFYLMYLQAHVGEVSFFAEVHSNFLLLSIAPVLVAVSTNYNKVPYWGYDLVKPVSRRDFVKEHGLVLLGNLFLYWLVFSMVFAVLPKAFHTPGDLLMPGFWAFLLMTGAYAFLVLAWIAVMSCDKEPRRVVLHTLLLCLVTGLQYLDSSVIPSAGEVLFVSFIYLVMAGILLKTAYHRWCEAEF